MLTAKGLLSARPRQGTIIEPEESWNLLTRRFFVGCSSANFR
jgi:DNA-binding FadR family transcriptional regulator